MRDSETNVTHEMSDAERKWLEESSGFPRFARPAEPDCSNPRCGLTFGHSYPCAPLPSTGVNSTQEEKWL